MEATVTVKATPQELNDLRIALNYADAYARLEERDPDNGPPVRNVARQRRARWNELLHKLGGEEQ